MKKSKELTIQWEVEDEDGMKVYVGSPFLQAAKDATQNILKELSGAEGGYNGLAELTNISRDSFDSEIKMGVNWSCYGATTVSNARAMAKVLEAAAFLAENFMFNGCYEGYYDTDNWTEDDREEARRHVKYFQNSIERYQRGQLVKAGIIGKEVN